MLKARSMELIDVNLYQTAYSLWPSDDQVWSIKNNSTAVLDPTSLQSNVYLGNGQYID